MAGREKPLQIQDEKTKHEEANDENWLPATEQGLKDYFESGRPAAPLRP